MELWRWCAASSLLHCTEKRHCVTYTVVVERMCTAFSGMDKCPELRQSGTVMPGTGIVDQTVRNECGQVYQTSGDNAHATRHAGGSSAHPSARSLFQDGVATVTMVQLPRVWEIPHGTRELWSGHAVWDQSLIIIPRELGDKGTPTLHANALLCELHCSNTPFVWRSDI